MLNQNDIRDKLQGIKGGVKHFWEKLSHREGTYHQADGRVDVNEVNEKGDATPSQAEKLVWDNEEASKQDKTYAFDEDNTDADYDFEDDLDFENDSDLESGQESRYR